MNCIFIELLIIFTQRERLRAELSKRGQNISGSIDYLRVCLGSVWSTGELYTRNRYTYLTLGPEDSRTGVCKLCRKSILVNSLISHVAECRDQRSTSLSEKVKSFNIPKKVNSYDERKREEVKNEFFSLPFKKRILPSVPSFVTPFKSPKEALSERPKETLTLVIKGMNGSNPVVHIRGSGRLSGENVQTLKSEPKRKRLKELFRNSNIFKHFKKQEATKEP